MFVYLFNPVGRVYLIYGKKICMINDKIMIECDCFKTISTQNRDCSVNLNII